MNIKIFESQLYINCLHGAFNQIPNAANKLKNKKILITGATGMIGSCLTDMLISENEKQNNIEIYAGGRDLGKIKERFCDKVNFVYFDARTDFESSERFDYIVHCASNADPRKFSTQPVDTLLSNVIGTDAMLKKAKENNARMLYVSSGEFYGEPDEILSDFDESYCGYVDCAKSRSCYPVGKRAGEVLCQCYIKQYGVSTVIARPCHIFGPTMTDTDSRAVTEFLRNAAKNQNIVMKSEGLIERSHCFVADAAAALLYILIYAEDGEAYNISDKKYQMTIKDFAEQTANAAGVKVIYELPDNIEKQGYSQRTRAVLSNEKLCNLGWKPFNTSNSAIEKTIQILRGQ